MHSSSHSKQTLSYLPYISDAIKYKEHFGKRQMYSPNTFHTIGPVSMTVKNHETEKSNPTVKIISPTEGAIERAKEDKKREDKEKVIQKKLHSITGRGRVRKSPQKPKPRNSSSKKGASSTTKKPVSSKTSAKKNTSGKKKTPQKKTLKK